MKTIYTVNLVNYDGCNFDNGLFSSLRSARKWAAGRGQTYSFGRWHNYNVTILKDDEIVMQYTTR